MNITLFKQNKWIRCITLSMTTYYNGIIKLQHVLYNLKWTPVRVSRSVASIGPQLAAASQPRNGPATSQSNWDFLSLSHIRSSVSCSLHLYGLLAWGWVTRPPHTTKATEGGGTAQGHRSPTIFSCYIYFLARNTIILSLRADFNQSQDSVSPWEALTGSRAHLSTIHAPGKQISSKTLPAEQKRPLKHCKMTSREGEETLENPPEYNNSTKLSINLHMLWLRYPFTYH